MSVMSCLIYAMGYLSGWSVHDIIYYIYNMRKLYYLKFVNGYKFYLLSFCDINLVNYVYPSFTFYLNTSYYLYNTCCHKTFQKLRIFWRLSCKQSNLSCSKSCGEKICFLDEYQLNHNQEAYTLDSEVYTLAYGSPCSPCLPMLET